MPVNNLASSFVLSNSRMFWFLELDQPIELSNGKVLHTLRDAGNHILTLPRRGPRSAQRCSCDALVAGALRRFAGLPVGRELAQGLGI